MTLLHADSYLPPLHLQLHSVVNLAFTMYCYYRSASRRASRLRWTRVEQEAAGRWVRRQRGLREARRAKQGRSAKASAKQSHNSQHTLLIVLSMYCQPLRVLPTGAAVCHSLSACPDCPLAEPWLHSNAKATNARISATQHETSAHELSTAAAEDTTATAAVAAAAGTSVQAALAAAEAAAAAATEAAMQANAALAAAKAAAAAAAADGTSHYNGITAEGSDATTLVADATGTTADVGSAASSATVAVSGGGATQSSQQHVAAGVAADSTGSDEMTVQVLYDVEDYLELQYDNGLAGAVMDGEEEWADAKQAHVEPKTKQQGVTLQHVGSADGSSVSGITAGGAGAAGADPAEVLADPNVWFGEDYWLRQNELTHLKHGPADTLKAHEDIILGSSGEVEAGAAGGATGGQAAAQHPEEFSVYGSMQQLVTAEGKQQQESAFASEDSGVLPNVDTVALLDYDGVEEVYFDAFQQGTSTSTAHVTQGGDDEQPYLWYELDVDPYYDELLYEDPAAVVRVTAGEGRATADSAALLGDGKERQQQQQQMQQLSTAEANHAAAVLSSEEDLPVMVLDSLGSLVGGVGQQQQQQGGSANGVVAAGGDAVLSTSSSNAGAASATAVATAAIEYSYDVSAELEQYYDVYDGPLLNDPWYDYELQQFMESWDYSYAYGYYDPVSIPDDNGYDADAMASLERGSSGGSSSSVLGAIDHDDDEYVLSSWGLVRQSMQQEQQQDASTAASTSAAAADAAAGAAAAADVVSGGDGFEFTWEDAASVLLAGDDGTGGAASDGDGATQEAAAAVAAFADAVFGDAAVHNEQQQLLRGAFLSAVERWQHQESSSSGGGGSGGEIQDGTSGMSRAELLSRAGELLAAKGMAHLGAAGDGAAAVSVGHSSAHTEHELPLPHGFESHEHAMSSDSKQDADAWEAFVQYSFDQQQQQQRVQHAHAAAVAAGASSGATLEAASAGVAAATALPQQQQQPTNPQPSRASAISFMAGTAFGIAAMLLLAGMGMAYYTIGGWSYGLPPASPPAAARARKPAPAAPTARRQTRGSRSASVSSWSSDNSSAVAGPPHGGWAAMFGAAAGRFGASAGAKHVSFSEHVSYDSDRLDAPLLMLSHDSELESDGPESSGGSVNTHISEQLQVHPEPSVTWSINHLAPLPSFHPEQHRHISPTATTAAATATTTTSKTSPSPSHDLPPHTLRVRTASISTDPTAAPASPRTAPAPTTTAAAPAGPLPSSARVAKSSTSPLTRVLPATPVSASAAASPRHHLSPFVVAVSAARLNSPLSPPLCTTNSPSAAAAETPRRQARAGSGSGTTTTLVNAAYAEFDQGDEAPLCRSSCSFTAGDAQLANLRRRVHNSYASHPNSPTIGQNQNQQPPPRSPHHAAVHVHDVNGPYAAASPARHSVSWSSVGYGRMYGNAMGGGLRPLCPVEMAAGSKLLPSSPLAAVAAAAAGAAPCNSPVAARRSRLASVVEAV